MYEIIDVVDQYSGEKTGENIIHTSEDGVISYIPNDESNSDYQAYLLWLEEQA
jgi:hypothetical protein